MSEPTRERKVLGGVQSLRALAALGVVVSHASSHLGAPLLVGEARVDLFFVISGLTMWFMRDRYPAPGKFLADRFFRVVPLYWLATSVMVLGALIHLFPHLTLSPPHVAASYAFYPWPHPDGGNLKAPWPLLVQGWTMNYEIFFYVLFALSFVLPRARQTLGLCVLLIGLSLIGLVFNPRGNAAHFYTDPILLEFLAGIGVGYCLMRGLLPGRGLAIAISAVGFIAMLGEHYWWPEAPRYLGYGAPAAIVLYGVVAMEKAGVPVVNRALMFLGNASYSIYLFHTFAVDLMAKAFGVSLGVFPSIILDTIVGYGFGVIVYLILEKPLMRAIKNARTAAKGPAAPVVAPS